MRAKFKPVKLAPALIALGVIVVFCLLRVFHLEFFERTEKMSYDWRVRQANRYLTELDRRRELWPVILGIWVGVIAVVIAILAMPLRDSVLCRALTWLGLGVCR